MLNNLILRRFIGVYPWACAREAFWKQCVAECRQGLWLVATRSGRQIPVKVEDGSKFAYQQSMTERIYPLVFVSLAFNDAGTYAGCDVSTIDPQVLMFRRRGDALEIGYNEYYRGGYGWAYYCDDFSLADCDTDDDRKRLECRDRALREYMETKPIMRPVIVKPRKKRPGKIRVESFEKV